MPTPSLLPAVPDPERDLVSSVLLDATPERVFAAYADPALLARWWGPEGFTSTFHEFDFREGCRWRFDLHGPDGASYANESVFLEISRPHHVVLDHVVQPHFRLFMTLTPRGGMTELVWRMRLETPALREKLAPLVIPANSENFDRLGRLLFQQAEAEAAAP